MIPGTFGDAGDQRRRHDMLRTAIVATTALAIVVVGCLTGLAQSPRTHRLEATPTTVAYGYYWAEAKPVLRIASGDIIDVDTLLTNSPTGLQRAGVPPERIQESFKAIVAEVTGDRRGPRGHILTGPVVHRGRPTGRCARGQDPLSRLRHRLWVQRLQRFYPCQLRPSCPAEDPDDRQTSDDLGVQARHSRSLEAVLWQHGSGAVD